MVRGARFCGKTTHFLKKVSNNVKVEFVELSGNDMKAWCLEVPVHWTKEVHYFFTDDHTPKRFCFNREENRDDCCMTQHCEDM